MKALVAYFSASGVTRRIATSVAEVCEADMFEIKPEVAYTIEDIDYSNEKSRSSLEMGDLNCRPAMAAKAENIDEYDTVLIGFPIWWGREPSIIDTFLDSVDWNGKTIIPFCTSAQSDIPDAVARISELTGANVAAGCRIGADATAEEIKELICK